MNVGNALKVACVGFAASIVIRLVDMLYFYDYTTGFYTDGGLLSWTGIGVALLASVLAVIMCLKDKRSFFGPYTPRKNMITGIVALVSAAALFYMAWTQVIEHLNHVALGYIGRNYAQSSVIHIIFIGMSVVFGCIQIVTAVGCFTGKNPYSRARLLYIAAVIWGLIYLILVFVYYGKSSSHVENMYTVIGAGLLVLCLLYMAELMAGIGGEKAAKLTFVLGIPAVIINLTYTVSNVVLSILGNSYFDFGEIPMAVQLGNLGVSLYVLSFLFTFKKYSLKRRPRGEKAPANARGGQRYSK